MSTPDDPFKVPDPIEGPDEEANLIKLQKEFNKYQQALQEEWKTEESYKRGELAPSEIRDKTKELLTSAVPEAVARLLYLCNHGKNENVQLKAAQYIVDKAIGKEIGGLVGDPVEELLKSINAK